MKRIVITLLALMLCCPLMAQRFSIFKCSEGVTIKKRNSTEWTTVARRDNISLLDVVKIPDGGSIAILDTTSNRIYKSAKAGESTLKLLIDNARNEADNIAKLLNSEIQQSHNGGGSSGYTSYGAMQRGDSDATIYTSLCNALISAALTSYSASSEISASIIAIDNNEIAFEVENRGDINLYFNILRHEPATGKFSLCYTFERNSGIEGYLIGAKSKRSLRETIFAHDTNSTIHYIPFATKEPIDGRLLQLNLQKFDAAQLETKDAESDILIIGNTIINQ